MGIITTLIVSLTFGFSSVNSQTGKEILVCDFEMPMDCGFVVRTAAGGIQWSLNNGRSYEGRVYGPPNDHTKGTSDASSHRAFTLVTPSKKRQCRTVGVAMKKIAVRLAVKRDCYYASTVVVANSQVALVYPVQTDMMSPTIQLPSGEGSLVFYFYVWRAKRNDQQGTNLNVYGCQGRKLWGTTVHVTMQGWQRLEIPLHCVDAFEIYFEGIHETVDSSISIDDVTIYASSLDAGNHSPLPPYNPGIGAPEVPSIPASTATSTTGTSISTWPITDAVTPTKLSIGNTVRGNNGAGTFLAVILFFLAFLLLSVSVGVHMYFWKKRWSRNKDSHRQKSTGIQLQNSAYDCLTLQPGAINELRGSPEGHSLSSSTRSSKEGRTSKSHVIDVDGSMSTGAATLDRKRSTFRSGRLHRTRSKTLPSKNSTLTESSSFKYYEIVEVDETTGKNVFRRAPKLSVIGKRGAISRSNSVPCQSQSSNGYEQVEWIGPGGLYHITNLIKSPLRRTVFSFDADSLSSFESRSNLGQWSNYTTPFGSIMQRQSVRDSGSSIFCPSIGPCTHRYSTPSPRQSGKFKNDEVFVDDNLSAKQSNQGSNPYDTPQARRKAYRKQSTDQRQASQVKSPNYYTLEPTSFIPDIVASNKLVSSSSESSRDSERIECLDSAGSCNTLNDVLTDHEGEGKL